MLVADLEETPHWIHTVMRESPKVLQRMIITTAGKHRKPVWKVIIGGGGLRTSVPFTLSRDFVVKALSINRSIDRSVWTLFFALLFFHFNCLFNTLCLLNTRSLFLLIHFTFVVHHPASTTPSGSHNAKKTGQHKIELNSCAITSMQKLSKYT
jgi:hypothetical protein